MVILVENTQSNYMRVADLDLITSEEYKDSWLKDFGHPMHSPDDHIGFWCEYTNGKLVLYGRKSGLDTINRVLARYSADKANDPRINDTIKKKIQKIVDEEMKKTDRDGIIIYSDYDLDFKDFDVTTLADGFNELSRDDKLSIAIEDSDIPDKDKDAFLNYAIKYVKSGMSVMKDGTYWSELPKISKKNMIDAINIHYNSMRPTTLDKYR